MEDTIGFGEGIGVELVGGFRLNTYIGRVALCFRVVVTVMMR